jgi:hypothetical protein
LTGNISHNDYFLRNPNPLQPLEHTWFYLRLIKQDGEQLFNCFLRYDAVHNSSRTQKQDQYVELFDKNKCMMEQVDRIERYAREFQQLNTAMMSYQESRATIKQAKMALQESRRTKLSESRSLWLSRHLLTQDLSLGSHHSCLFLCAGEHKHIILWNELGRTQQHWKTSLGFHCNNTRDLCRLNLDLGLLKPILEVSVATRT